MTIEIDIGNETGELKLTNEELKVLGLNSNSDQELSEMVSLSLDAMDDYVAEQCEEEDSAAARSVRDLMKRRIDICARNANGLVVMSKPLRIVALAGIFASLMDLR